MRAPQIVYFGRCVPWIIIDAIPHFRRWKLQPDKIPTAKDQWECTKGVLFSHFTVQLPLVCDGVWLVSLAFQRLSQDLVVPPNCRGSRNEHLASSLPCLEGRRASSCVLLRLRRHVPLLRYVNPFSSRGKRGAYISVFDSPSIPPLGPDVQAHPQNSPQILSTLRPCCRVRPSG